MRTGTRLLVAAVVAAAACSGSSPAAAPTSAPTTIATSPGPSAPSSSSSAPATSAPAGCDGVQAVAAPARPGAKLVNVACVRRVTDPAIAAVSFEQPGRGQGGPPPPLVDLYLRNRDGWELLADLSKLPVGRPLVGFEGQILETLQPLDFDRDGNDSLVLGVLSVGASTGPLDVSVLSFRGPDIAVDLQVGTQSGGTLSVDGKVLVLETGSYAPGDPHCCPSGRLRQRIGWSQEHKKVEVLEQSVTPVSSRT